MKRVAIDTGGTFTDLVLLDGDSIDVHKVSSTPDDPSRAIREGLSRWFADLSDVEVVHGSTVGTNALLERKGAVTALVTTAGFEDVLEIGRQNRPRLYDLDQTREPPLVPAERRLGARERTWFDGSIGIPLSDDETRRIAGALREIAGLESVAVVLLHSYANPAHEEALGAALAPLGLPISLSWEVLPEYREYERTSTTVVNAYLAPIMSRYLDRLEEVLRPERLRVMHSGGGMMSARAAGRFAGRTVLSGPAGGVLGGARIARLAGRERAITFDMGGTSTDVSLVRGRPASMTEAEVEGMPIRFPMLDVHTVGAGGGSIAELDPGGALAVGPRSAGAVPGPACYGRGGTRVTVTDANLYLGRLVPERFLGGRMALDPAAARGAVESLAVRAGMEPLDLARGVLRVAGARMERAIRVISVERGHDPREYCLVAFGGAGPMHACDLASLLSIPAVLVPPEPGALSARGMLFADVVEDSSRTWLGRPVEELDSGFAELEAEARRKLDLEGFSPDRIVLERELDVRYAGQSFELTVAAGHGWRDRFDASHAERYGHAHPDWRAELVSLRLRAVGRVDDPPLAREEEGPPDASSALGGSQPVCFERVLETPIYDRGSLVPGHEFPGPALVVEMSATTVVEPGWRVRVDGWRNLILERGNP